MKKRILALALTLAMVVTSLSMLSFVSFAEGTPEEPTFEATDGNLFAWLYTLNVDAGVDRDDPLMMATTPLINDGDRNLYMTTAWDYDNVYLHMYYTGIGTSNNYLDYVSWTVGGANATASTIKAGVEHSGTFTKISANYYCCEMAIPLSEVNAKLEDGVLSADMILDIVYNANGDHLTKNYNLVFSGNSLITKMFDANNASPTTGGFTGFGGRMGVIRSGTDHGNKTDNATAPTVGKAGVAEGLAGNTKMRFWDQTNYVADSNQNFACLSYLNIDGYGWVNPTLGHNEGNRIETVVNVGNLMPQTATTNTNRSSSYFGDDTCIFQIKSGAVRRGYGDPQGARAGIYTTLVDGVEHVMLSLATADATSVHCDLTATYGITEGKNFHFAMEEYSNGNTAVYINGHKALEGKIVGNGWVGAGAITTVLKRVGNIDANNDATITADEYLDVTLTRFALSKINEVDVETVSAKFKTVNGEAAVAPTGYVIVAESGTGVNLDIKNAITFSGAPVSIGSASKAWATFDTDAAMLYLILDNRNIDKFDVNVGGAEAEVTFERKSDNFEDRTDNDGVRGFTALVAKCVSEDNITAATHDLYNAVAGTLSPTDNRGWHRTLVSIPLSELVITKGEGDIFTTDISITATNSDQLKWTNQNGNVTGKVGQYVGTFEGTIAFDLSTQATTEFTIANRGPSYSAAGSTAQSRYYTGESGLTQDFFTNTTTTRSVRFDMRVDALTALTLDEVNSDLFWAWNAGVERRAHVFMLFFGSKFAAEGAPGGAVLQLYNTTNGGTDGGESLVLVHSAEVGKNITIIPLDKKVGDSFNIELIWNEDNSGSVLVDGVVVFEADEIRHCINHGIVTTANANSPKRGGFYMIEYLGKTTNDTINYEMTNIAADYHTNAVDTEVLTANAKLAYVQESAVVDDTYSIRLVGTINTIRASEAGFEVSVKGEEGEPTVYSSTTVYNSVYQNVSGEPELLNAPTGTKFFTAVIPSIAAVADVEKAMKV